MKRTDFVARELLIKEDFHLGSSLEEIAQKHGLSLSGALKSLHRQSLYLNDRKPQIDEQAVVDMYVSGSTRDDVCVGFGISISKFNRIMEEYKVARRTSADYTKYSHTSEDVIKRSSELSKKYNDQIAKQIAILKKSKALNVEFFSSITTEEQAYWLGFIIADGSINGNRVKIALSKVDASHLEKWKNSVGYTGEVKLGLPHYKNPNVAELSFSSKAMVDDLNKLGVGSNKTYKVKAPIDKIPTDLLRHFWRGVFDGDGTVAHSPRPQGRLRLVGNELICNGFLEWAKNHIQTEAKVCPHKSIYSVEINSIDAFQKLGDVLYNDCTIFLDRKWVKFQTINNLLNEFLEGHR